MAFGRLQLFKVIRSISKIHRNVMSTSARIPNEVKLHKLKEYQTEDNLKYLDDPDTFGSLNRNRVTHAKVEEDEGDKKEEEFLQNVPLPSQKLTIKQYSDLIKQYLKHKRLKEAIDILEVRMLKQDRVKPSNYIYNILIGACAEVGYTKKAFKLYNDMKRRGLMASGDTYTCLFEACANSPWALDGVKNAKHLRNFMIDKAVEPNLTNYNAMIKAFGRCGDLITAFQIVDEMILKKIKIRVHTLNHLLQACISDRETGLRHALVVWRKMLKLKEKPNIYSFNLMLKCVKDCNLGSKEDIEELIKIIQQETPAVIQNTNHAKMLQIEPPQKILEKHKHEEIIAETEKQNFVDTNTCSDINNGRQTRDTEKKSDCNTLTNVSIDVNSIQIIDKVPAKLSAERTVPNLLSKQINLQQVLGLQAVQTVQEKFAIIGGQEDFLKEMNEYSVKPDLKTFTQMLMLIDNNAEAETKLIETMKTFNIKTDIDFYNMLIKKRCLRSDYESAVAVTNMIEDYNKLLKKKHPLKKVLKLNIMSYGVLAMTCKTKENAEQLLSQMKSKQQRPNIQILGTLLRHGTSHNLFNYVVYIMNVVKEENVKVNEVFLQHLEKFNEKCTSFLQQVDETGQRKSTESFEIAYKRFSNFYNKWLQEVNIDEALKSEHPWQQFRDSYPETIQRTDINIKEPKRFYKRDRKFAKYTPTMLQ